MAKIDAGAFELLRPDRPLKADIAPVRIGMMAFGRTRAGVRPFLYIRSDVLALIGGPGGRYDFQMGRSAETRHFLRLTRGETGLFVATEMGLKRGSGTWRFLLSRSPSYPRVKVLPEPCRYEAEGEAVYITMPSWLWDPRRAREIENRAASGATA